VRAGSVRRASPAPPTRSTWQTTDELHNVSDHIVEQHVITSTANCSSPLPPYTMAVGARTPRQTQPYDFFSVVSIR
jgi:hypothetical protein